MHDQTIPAFRQTARTADRSGGSASEAVLVAARALTAKTGPISTARAGSKSTFVAARRGKRAPAWALPYPESWRSPRL